MMLINLTMKLARALIPLELNEDSSLFGSFRSSVYDLHIHSHIIAHFKFVKMT